MSLLVGAQGWGEGTKDATGLSMFAFNKHRGFQYLLSFIDNRGSCLPADLLSEAFHLQTCQAHVSNSGPTPSFEQPPWKMRSTRDLLGAHKCAVTVGALEVLDPVDSAVVFPVRLVEFKSYPRVLRKVHPGTWCGA